MIEGERPRTVGGMVVPRTRELDPRLLKVATAVDAVDNNQYGRVWTTQPYGQGERRGEPACKSYSTTFRTQAHNLLHMEHWVNDMLKEHGKLTAVRATAAKRGSSSKLKGVAKGAVAEKPKVAKNAKAEQLPQMYKDQARHFSICFEELARQTFAYNPHLCGMLQKVWRGHSALLNRLAAVYIGRENEIADLGEHMRQVISDAEGLHHQREAKAQHMKFQQQVLEKELQELQAEGMMLRRKMQYYEDEVVRLRSVLQESVNGVAHGDAVHDSIKVEEEEEAGVGRARTVLELAEHTSKLLQGQEKEVGSLLLSIGKEGRKQQECLQGMRVTLHEIQFEEFLKGVETHKRPSMRTMETQTRRQLGADEAMGGAGAGAATAGDGDAAAMARPTRKARKEVAAPLPRDLLRLIGSSAQVKKVPTLGYMLKAVLEVYLSISHEDRVEASRQRLESPGAVTALVQKHFQGVYGTESTANQMLAAFAVGLASFRDYKRLAIFGDFMGVTDFKAPPERDERAFLFLINVLHQMRLLGGFGEFLLGEKLQSTKVQQEKARGALRTVLSELSDTPVAELVPILGTRGQRQKARKQATNIFSLEGAAAARENVINLDQFIKETALAWEALEQTWASHLEFAFKHYCSTYQVVKDMHFASDDPAHPLDSDTVISELDKEQGQHRQRRPLRIPTMTPADLEDEVRVANEGVAGKPPSYQGSPGDGEFSWVVDSGGVATVASVFDATHSSVVDLLTQTDFEMCLSYINPSIPDDDIEELFKACCNLMQNQTLKDIRKVWQEDEAENGKKCWTNKVTGKSQWTRPYRKSTFDRTDVDMSAFVQLCLKVHVARKSPLVRHFGLSPEALWEEWPAIVKKLPKESSVAASTGEKVQASMAWDSAASRSLVKEVLAAELRVVRDAKVVYGPPRHSSLDEAAAQAAVEAAASLKGQESSSRRGSSSSAKRRSKSPPTKRGTRSKLRSSATVAVAQSKVKRKTVARPAA